MPAPASASRRQQLSADGAYVSLADSRVDAIAALANELGEHTHALHLDVRSEDLMAHAMADLDVLINNEDLITRRIPVGRMALPREIAEIIAFLATPSSSYVADQTLIVDGGFLINQMAG